MKREDSGWFLVEGKLLFRNYTIVTGYFQFMNGLISSQCHIVSRLLDINVSIVRNKIIGTLA